MKAFATLCLLIGFFSGTAHAGQIKPFDAALVGKRSANDKVQIQYCELGYCSPIGEYTKPQWEQVGEICSGYSIAGDSAVSMVSNTLALLIVGAPGGAGIKALTLSGLFALDGKVTEDEAAVTADTLKGLTTEDNFQLTIEQFVNLKNGIIKCAKEYEWRNSRIYKKYINGWARPLG